MTHTDVIFGLGAAPGQMNLRTARHRTRVKGVFANYFEIWNSMEGGRKFCLDKAYFHLHFPQPDGSDDELLALHCDPKTHMSDPIYKYKCGPHLHVAFKKFDFHKSHIALCLQNFEKICSDFGLFSQALADFLKMIDDEYLTRIDDLPK